MNFLEKIVAQKRKEIEHRKNQISSSDLTKMELFERDTVSFSKAITNGSGIIAEFKRKSPSAGNFNTAGDLEKTITYYEQNEVSAYSILTDFEKFGGSLNDILTARVLTDKPILRKDFIIDEYQLFEAKAHGADAILLIADALDEFHCENLTTIAKSLNLEVLMEFHSKNELIKLNDNVDVIGINNRNLKTLQTNVDTSLDLIKYLPYDRVKISESGIENVQQIKQLIPSNCIAITPFF
jgi:indole-3-glycerol phosphate synthase